jgi:hypothetical protein
MLMTEPRSLYNSPLRRSNCINDNTGGRIFYNSPRIDIPDELLFPAAAAAAIASSERGVRGGDHDNAGTAAPASSSVAALPAASGVSLSDSLARWRYMAELAGQHRQPHDILRVNLDRVSAPAALVAGMPSRIGRLIQTLHLPLADDASQLPEWLDAIATAFPHLLHLHLQGDKDEHDDDVQEDVEKDNELQTKDKEVENGSRGPPSQAKAGLVESDHKPKTLSDEVLVRRLYVLYRLPRLQSMDGEPFSEQEQKLARPRDHRRSQADDEDSPAAVTDKNTAENGALVEQQQQEKERRQKQRRPSGGPLGKEMNESCLLDDSSDEDEGEAVVHHNSNEKTATLAIDGEVEIGLNGRPMAMSSCDPDRWESASIESGAVACDWACGSLPYFQRNETTGREQQKRQQRNKSKKSQRQARLTVRTRSDGDIVGGRRSRPHQQQQQQQQHHQEPPPKSKQHQTSMPLNQFTFEDSIEIDNTVSTVLERCLRVSTPPTEKKALVVLEQQHQQHNESPVSSSSSRVSQKSNQENVVVSLRPPPPTRSLTSPFPMQFRSSRGVTERVDKLIGAISDESEHTLETVDSHQTATIIPLMRIQSSPSNLSMKPLPGGKKNRPPPCPGRRAPLGSRPQRTKRRQNRWRERLNARSNSILDDDDEDEDDDNDEEDEQQKEDSGQSEKEAAMLQPKGLRLT